MFVRAARQGRAFSMKSMIDGVLMIPPYTCDVPCNVHFYERSTCEELRVKPRETSVKPRETSVKPC